MSEKPDTSPPTPKRAMMIFAHPDDPDFGVAGTAALWRAAGADVMYVLITSGNVGTHDDGMDRVRLAAIREDEQRAAAAECGVTEVVFLGYDDGTLQPTLELRRDLVRLIRSYRPDVVVCGDPTMWFFGNEYINHPDHRAAATAVLDAVFPTAGMRLVFPELAEAGFAPHKVREVWVTMTNEADTYVDISSTFERKISALRQHKSQLADWDPTDMVATWAKDTGASVGLAMAEGYRRLILEREDVPDTAEPDIAAAESVAADGPSSQASHPHAHRA